MGTYATGSFHVHPWILYFLVVMLSSYVAVDLLANHSHLPLFLSCPSAPPSGSGLAPSNLPPADSPPACSTLEGHLDTGDPSTRRPGVGPDAWRQMKWIGQPATCPVRGHLIERLDAAHNFRRGFALRYAKDVEDKTHILPWLLGSRIDLNKRARRVYLDLGANALSTSITWFLRMYPCDFNEVHAFEVDKNLLKKPLKGFNEDSNLSPANEWSLSVKQVPSLPQWMLDRITLHHKFVSDVDDVDSHAINITRFIKEELKLKASDTVVVKMDIEGSEWPILKKWMEDLEMVEIIDELFVEVHYDHPSMWAYHWRRFAPIKREEANHLLADLRFHGFFAHAWP